MKPEEYDNLSRVERDHWYYAGKRELARWWLDRTLRRANRQRLLDFGAGTGAFARELRDRFEVWVQDLDENSLRFLREHFPPDQVIASAAEDLAAPDGFFDAVTALDVLEHIEHDDRAVAAIHKILKPGGVFLATVPASMALWSDWDESLHHFRRYDRRGLRALFPEDAWEVCHLNYTNVVVFPAVWAIRRSRRWIKVKRAEDSVPPAPINRLLRFVFVGMGKLRRPFPFGVSLLIVARRKA